MMNGEDLRDLIERTSLGTDGARQLRARMTPRLRTALRAGRIEHALDETGQLRTRIEDLADYCRAVETAQARLREMVQIAQQACGGPGTVRQPPTDPTVDPLGFRLGSYAPSASSSALLPPATPATPGAGGLSAGRAASASAGPDRRATELPPDVAAARGEGTAGARESPAGSHDGSRGDPDNRPARDARDAAGACLPPADKVPSSQGWAAALWDVARADPAARADRTMALRHGEPDRWRVLYRGRAGGATPPAASAPSDPPSPGRSPGGGRAGGSVPARASRPDPVETPAAAFDRHLALRNAAGGLDEAVLAAADLDGVSAGLAARVSGDSRAALERSKTVLRRLVHRHLPSGVRPSPGQLEHTEEIEAVELLARACAGAMSLQRDLRRVLDIARAALQDALHEAAAWCRSFGIEGKRALQGTAATLFVRLDLRGAWLAGQDFSGLNLRDTRMARSNLVEADLAGADLTGADLAEALIEGVTWTHTTVWPEHCHEWIRARSTEVEDGVFRVFEPGQPVPHGFTLTT